MTKTFHIHVQDSTFVNGSSVVSETHYSYDKELCALLKDLEELKNNLENTEPLISDAVSNLQQAIKAQNKHNISKYIGQLTGKTIVSVLSGIATPRILSFLGLS